MSAIKIVFVLGFLVESDRIPSKINFNQKKRKLTGFGICLALDMYGMASGMVEARGSKVSRMVSACFLALALLSLTSFCRRSSLYGGQRRCFPPYKRCSGEATLLNPHHFAHANPRPR